MEEDEKQKNPYGNNWGRRSRRISRAKSKARSKSVKAKIFGRSNWKKK